MMESMLNKQWKLLDCDRMQIWLETGIRQHGVDLVMGEDLLVDGAALYIENRQVGRKVDVSNSEGKPKRVQWQVAWNGYYLTSVNGR